MAALGCGPTQFLHGQTTRRWTEYCSPGSLPGQLVQLQIDQPYAVLRASGFPGSFRRVWSPRAREARLLRQRELKDDYTDIYRALQSCPSARPAYQLNLQ